MVEASWRNGYRDRSLDTRLDTLNLWVPKLRQGSYFPGFLEARKTSEQALVAVIQEAWIGGVSTRRVDDLVQAMTVTTDAPASRAGRGDPCRPADCQVEIVLPNGRRLIVPLGVDTEALARILAAVDGP